MAELQGVQIVAEGLHKSANESATPSGSGAETPPDTASVGKEFINQPSALSLVLRGGASSVGGEGQHSKVLKVMIEWQNLNYTLPIGKWRSKRLKTILCNASGCVPPGRLLAVMGPSGSGKTSLINALAGRLPHGGNLSGSVLVNGAPRTKTFRNIAAYVPQDDILLSNLTVQETFATAADLRLPSGTGAAARRELVQDLITQLGLANAAHSRVGNAFVRGVSGGERKRVNIGVEMIGNPSIIFMDEPTSGLDAYQAQNVMAAMWNLAKAGRTVLATIHQPRSSIFGMFDLLLLLSEGRTIYFGPADAAVEHFAAQGFPCPQHYNPADFFLDVISVDVRSVAAQEECRARIDTLAKAGAANHQAEADACSHALPDGEQLLRIKQDYSFATTWGWQWLVLFRRAWKQGMRDKMSLGAMWAQTLVLALLLGIVWISMDKTQKGIQDLTGLLFFVCIFAAFSNLMAVLNTFPAEKAVVNRERASKSYRVSSYYSSKIVSEAPVRVLATLVFSTIVYWMTGLAPSAEQFFLFWTIIILTALAAQGLGVAVSATVSSEKMAFALAPFITIMLILFGGFYINSDSIPAWLSWIKWLSFIYYAFAALMVNELQGECCWECPTACVAFDDNGQCTETGPAPGCLSTGDEILERYGYGSWQLWEAYLGIICCLLVHHVLGYAMLRLRKPRFAPLHTQQDGQGLQQT